MKSDCGVRTHAAQREAAGSLTYPLHVQVLHRLGDGVEDGAGLALREELLPQDLVQQLAALHQLRHQEHRAAVVVHLRRGDGAAGSESLAHGLVTGCCARERVS